MVAMQRRRGIVRWIEIDDAAFERRARVRR
jgi:hypothetical protein